MLPSTPQITVVKPDGRSVGFDPAGLRLSVLQAFMQTGTKDDFLAEDVALAVEYLLLQSGRPGLNFHESEITAAVVSILERAGLPDAAACYSRLNAQRKMSVAATRELLTEFIAGHLTPEGEERPDAAALAEKVAAALDKLAIRQTSPQLCLELARHYAREARATDVTAGKLPPPRPEFISPEELSRLAPEPLRELADADILRFCPISRRIFPSARVVFKLAKFTAAQGLTPPVTEMMLATPLARLGAMLEGAFAAFELYFERNTGSSTPLPRYLLVPDMEEFAQIQLQLPLPEAARICAGVIAGALPKNCRAVF